VIISHGEMANGMVDAACMIIGEQEGVVTVILKETDDVDGLKKRVETALQQVDAGDGVLVLVDLFGATPFNVSARVAVEHDQVEVITGMNLPMLLEVALQRESQGFAELVEIAKEAGRSGVRILSESLDKHRANE
jgi:PTS system mannose-specific IIA component